MTCKNCGADLSINDVRCPYCRSYIDRPFPNQQNNYGYPNYQPVRLDPTIEVRREADRDSGNALLLSIFGLILGFFIIRIVFAVISLRMAVNAKKQYQSIRMYSPGKVNAAIILSIIDIAIAVITGAMFLGMMSFANRFG